MADLLSNATGAVEDVLAPLGLMQGENAVAKRMAFGALLGGVIVSFFKPGNMFDDHGNARPWSLQVGSNYAGPEPTSFPWWTASIAGAVIFSTLI
jgi:hypothetical protein